MPRLVIVCENGVGSFKVLELNPVFDHAVGLEAALQLMQIDGLLFERSPQPFDHCRQVI